MLGNISKGKMGMLGSVCWVACLVVTDVGPISKGRMGIVRISSKL